MNVLAIPAFVDNYIWMLEHGDAAVVVDPGDAAPVERELAARRLALGAILLTHHHADHIGGADELARRHGCAVHAPDDPRIGATTHAVRDGDRVELGAIGLTLEVHAIPGHTSSHIAFAGAGELFCGDTLFAGGCGRLFEGTPAQMVTSLDRLAALPGTTRVWCGHEYTVANLAFARAVEPRSAAIAARLERETERRARGAATLPSTIALEHETNPFLRCDEATVRASAERHAGHALEARVDVFATLRAWKNEFRVAA